MRKTTAKQRREQYAERLELRKLITDEAMKSLQAAEEAIERGDYNQAELQVILADGALDARTAIIARPY